MIIPDGRSKMRLGGWRMVYLCSSGLYDYEFCFALSHSLSHSQFQSKPESHHGGGVPRVPIPGVNDIVHDDAHLLSTRVAILFRVHIGC